MQRGFSLVELSIVLVILGLFTGGILAGQSLIRAAELRAVSAEFQRYIAATQTFRDKYMAIPGDMNNATRFWNRQENQSWCITGSSASVTTSGTCDGNGDGMLGFAAAASQSGEMFQYWRQLALAGFIEGTYTGYAGATAADLAVIGSNVPASRISVVGWTAMYRATGVGTEPAVSIGNHFRVGTATAGTTAGSFLEPEEMWNIDTKMDDGRPLSGGLIIRDTTINTCSNASSSSDLAASYLLSSSTVSCAMLVKIGA